MIKVFFENAITGKCVESGKLYKAMKAAIEHNRQVELRKKVKHAKKKNIN